MGWWFRRETEPVVHPPVARAVLVPAPPDAVLARLDEYGALWSPRHSVERTCEWRFDGRWTIVRLPDDVHPGEFHNLAMWLADTSGAGGEVLARSAASVTRPAYWLVVDPELPDCLCGWDERGRGITIDVPSNDLVEDDAVPVRREPPSAPAFDDPEPWRAVDVRLEVRGAEGNAANVPTVRSRRHLSRRSGPGVDLFVDPG